MKELPVFIAFVAALTLCPVLPDVAWADILEVRDKGFLNGKIASETDTQIQFVDGKGETNTFLKADILSRVNEDKNANCAATSNASSIVSSFSKKVEPVVRRTREWFHQYLSQDASRRMIAQAMGNSDLKPRTAHDSLVNRARQDQITRDPDGEEARIQARLEGARRDLVERGMEPDGPEFQDKVRAEYGMASIEWLQRESKKKGWLEKPKVPVGYTSQEEFEARVKTYRRTYDPSANTRRVREYEQGEKRALQKRQSNPSDIYYDEYLYKYDAFKGEFASLDSDKPKEER